MTESHSYHSLLWAAKKALIGEIPLVLRGVAVEWQKSSSPKEDVIHT